MTRSVLTSSSHPTVKRLFANRQIAVSTKHGKDLVMRPLIRQYLNLEAFKVNGVNTDLFGTFTGEVERPFDPVTTLRKKILEGLQVSGNTLGIGNEGSFGPHPHTPFLTVDQELVMFIDLEHNLEVCETVVSTETNHAQRDINHINDLIEFADKVHFPSHGLILKQMDGDEIVHVRKGILDWETLYSAYLQLRRSGKSVVAETDMRAYLNPTRMRIIERATEHLMKKITTVCPECQWPGFGCVEHVPGLPCKHCGAATNELLVKVYQCSNCSYTDERYYTKDTHADPMYCNICNP
jgi:hypothetical protein